jgi:hypothetical protein
MLIGSAVTGTAVEFLKKSPALTTDGRKTFAKCSAASPPNTKKSKRLSGAAVLQKKKLSFLKIFMT